jgi:outer membrane protein assembly factor BamB
MMALNAYLLHSVDPLESPALATLSEQLAQDADNVTLQQQVRELDLLARRAFFVRQWQLQTGAMLLAVGLLVCVVGLFLMTGQKRRLPDLQACPGMHNPWRDVTRARVLIVTLGLLLLAIPIGLQWSMRTSGMQRDRATTSSGNEGAPAHTPIVQDDDQAPTPQTGVSAVVKPDLYWPAFRGEYGLGIAPPEAKPPVNWDGTTGAGIRWKAAVPRPGTSSPVIWGNRLFLTGADAEAREVYCFDADTGTLLWRADTAGIAGIPDSLPKVLDDTGHAAPSVAVDGQRVVAIFSTGVIAGFDFEGRRLWGHALGIPDNLYGHSASLLSWQGMVYVQFDQHGSSQVLALDMETGKTRWRQERGAETSWSSPILIPAPDAGKMQLVLSAAPMVAAYDASTGETQWSQDVLSGEIGSSPAFADGRVFVANEYAQAVALDAISGEVRWTSNAFELPDAGSPVATEQFLFLPSTYGVFTCVDVKDGTMVWEHEFNEGGYGSPILSGTNIYWMTSSGQMRIFKATDSFELIAEPRLGEQSHGTPALVGKRLYIRGEQHVFCIEEAP